MEELSREQPMEIKTAGMIETETIARLVNRYQFSLSIEEAYAVTAQSLDVLLPADGGVLYVKDARQDLYYPIAPWGKLEEPLKSIGSEDCWALRRGRMHKVMAGSEDIRCRHIVAPSTGTDYLCVPILTFGEPLGLLHFATRDGRRSFPGKKQMVGLIADLLAMAIVNIRLRDRIQDIVDKDYLTGLYNRRSMEERFNRILKKAFRENTSIGLIMMDIDHFGYFTENYGHGAADAVLQDLGAFLNEYLYVEDLACRYGADEFFLILPGNSLDVSRKRAEHIRDLIKDRAMYESHQHIHRITVSMGVVAFPDHGNTMGDLIQCCINAVKQAKKDGRDRVKIGEE
jgi:diguanylate cyclase (GGDEF)-like protein